MCIRDSFGIRASSKISSYVDDPRIPIFFSFVPNENPGVPLSTMNAEKFFFLRPRLSSVMLVIAMMMYTSATVSYTHLRVKIIVIIFLFILPLSKILFLIIVIVACIVGGLVYTGVVDIPMASGVVDLSLIHIL